MDAQFVRLRQTEEMKIFVCLAAVLLSLVLVGIFSSTFMRHVVQTCPIAVALVATWGGWRLARYFALPVFAIWLLLMVLIWLYLLGVNTFFDGSFSAAEIVLTVLVGSFSVAGMRACLRPSTVPLLHRIAAVSLFLVVQVAAMWVSFLPQFANR